VDLIYPPEQQPELGGISRAPISLHDVFLAYKQQFRRWFAITAPTSLIAAVVLWTTDQQSRAIFGSIPRGQFQYHFAEIAETGLLRFGGFFIAWLLGAFALAAIATSVNNLESDDSDVWRHDSHQRAREHFGGLLLIAVFTFCAFLVGVLAVDLVLFAIIKEVGWAHFSRFNVAASLAGYVVVASILSWFGMAVPLILHGNIGVGAALKRSLKLSNGYEAFLFLLVIESLVGSYVAWYATHYCLALVFPVFLRYTVWHGWVVYFVSILASAAVQPPMFIGFSLLADEENPNLRFSPNSQQAS
jgi:hypothetical protein